MPIESGELTFFLKAFLLAIGYQRSFVDKVASHSMKATFLSYCAKFGVSLHQSQLLGYHVARGERSAVNYGRDNLAVPLQEMEKMLSDVRDGKFKLDEVRGKRWLKYHAPAADEYYVEFGEQVVISRRWRYEANAPFFYVARRVQVARPHAIAVSSLHRIIYLRHQERGSIPRSVQWMVKRPAAHYRVK